MILGRMWLNLRMNGSRQRLILFLSITCLFLLVAAATILTMYINILFAFPSRIQTLFYSIYISLSQM